MSYPHLYAVCLIGSSHILCCVVTTDVEDVFIETFERLGWMRHQVNVYDFGSVEKAPVTASSEMINSKTPIRFNV